MPIRRTPEGPLAAQDRREFGTHDVDGDLPIMLQATVEGVPITDQGKGIVIMQRQPDGAWLPEAVIWNSHLPLPE